jgi:hypothetical protein
VIWIAIGLLALVMILSGIFTMNHAAERNGLLFAGLVILAMYFFG